jgi:CheY-like chemotaxis protein
VTSALRPSPVVLIVGPPAAQSVLPLANLEEYGCVVRDGRTVADPVAVARQLRPDVLLVDASPVTDALAVCQALKADPDTADIPLIAVTGTPLSGQVMMTLSVQACTPESLALEVQRVLASRTDVV